MSENLEPSMALSVIPVDEQINQELVKNDIKDDLIASLKEKYMPLQIKDTDDKETYLLVKDARKECKALRVRVQKICKMGREEAVKIQKAWVAKEKEVTDKIGEVEDHLEKQEKEFEAAVAAEKARKIRQQEEQLIMRQQELTAMGALYSDGNFVLGDVSFERSIIKECDPDIWENDIKPKFEVEYRKIEAERIEQDRIKQEKEAELKRQQEEMERRERELAERETAIKAAQEKQERMMREEEEKKAAEAKAARDAKQKARMDQMYALGLKFDFSDNHFKGYSCFVSHLDVLTYNDEKWDRTVKELTAHIAVKKEEEEQKRLAEIEAQKEAERKMVLGQSRLKALKELGRVPIGALAISLSDLSEEEYDTLYANEKQEYEAAKRKMWEIEQEEKRQKEEQRKAEELLQASEKKKWADIIKQVNAIEIHEFRSGQYINKVKALKQKLEEIKAL